MLDAGIAHGSSGEIKEHHLGGFDRMHHHARFISDGSAVAYRKPLSIDFHYPPQNLDP